MSDATPQQVAEAGPDAIALMLSLMQRNERENTAIVNGLHESVRHERDEAYRTINRIRRNIAIVLRAPHTDAMIADAVTSSLAGCDYPDPDACA